MLDRTTALVTVVLLLLSAAGIGAQRKPAKKKPKDGIQPYDKVITKDAKSLTGVFRVHRLKNKLFYEIPPDALGQPFLWVTQVARTQAGHGYGGTPVRNRVVRWELRDENVLLRDVKYRIRAEVDGPIKTAVEATSLEPIIQAFPVKAWGRDKAPVIEVTDLFTSDVKEFSPARRLGASSMDKKRTFLDGVKAFPRNIETEVLATYKLSGSTARSRTRTPSPRRRPRVRRDSSLSAITVVLHHSMVKLPESPMQPRRHDARVGFFSVSFEDYGTKEHQVKTVRYITRWRLEKKDPEAAVSEPVKPIVFYVGRGVPAKWRPYVKQGIEKWQPAFEAAGFKNAILGKMAPSPQEDPDWDAEDARYSSIRWLPSTIENAMGPHVHDPRTGEILDADILVYHNVLKLARDWYFVQASPSDPRAQKLPLPDALLGEMLAYIVAHEVGHSLGFPHNMKASSGFSVKQLRDPEFTGKWGTEASIMDYGRFNYVAQPGDGAALIPKIGPYDYFAIDWGYRRFKSPEAERKGLAAAVAKQVDNPVYRFGSADPSEDPARQTEDLGDDSILATELGLKNIERVSNYLVKATCKKGKDYELLQNMYDQLVGQRDRELGHVVAVVGGVNRTNLWYGDRDRVYAPVTPERQRKAVHFLIEHAFETPGELVRPDILDRLEASGVADRVLSSQRRILSSLINDRRVKRMAELVERDAAGYAPMAMLRDVTEGIWREFGHEKFEVDLYRRNLQRAHVEHLASLLKRQGVDTDLPALARKELERIRAAVYKNPIAFKNEVTQAHAEDIVARIKAALDPKVEAKSTTARP
jgi:hypothetical protein